VELPAAGARKWRLSTMTYLRRPRKCQGCRWCGI